MKSKEAYAIMLPIPKISDVESQVIKYSGRKETYEGKSKLEIEHLFYNDETSKYFTREKTMGDGSYIKFSYDKTKFANEIVPTFKETQFQVFKPMFDFIKSKCDLKSKEKICQS